MPEALKVAIAGLGTVGAGVVKLLDANRDLIARRAGRPIEIVAVAARDRTRDRGIDTSRFEWQRRRLSRLWAALMSWPNWSGAVMALPLILPAQPYRAVGALSPLTRP